MQQGPDRVAVLGTFGVRDADGNDLGTLVAQQAMYRNQQPVTEVAIRATFGSDLYLVMNGVDLTKNIANVDVFIEPGVPWIWVGMIIVIIGAVVAAWPRRANMQARDTFEPELTAPERADRREVVPA